MNISRMRDFPSDPLGDKPAGELLVHGGELLEAAGIDYWLSAGTMMGVYRDGAPIKEDTDLDVGVTETTEKAIQAALKGYELVQIAEHDGEIQQLAFMYEDVIFDVYFYFRNGEYFENWNNHGLMKKPVDLIDEREEIKFMGHTFTTPKTPDYLEWRYGETWNVPNRTGGDWSGLQRA